MYTDFDESQSPFECYHEENDLEECDGLSSLLSDRPLFRSLEVEAPPSFQEEQAPSLWDEASSVQDEEDYSLNFFGLTKLPTLGSTCSGSKQSCTTRPKLQPPLSSFTSSNAVPRTQPLYVCFFITRDCPQLLISLI